MAELEHWESFYLIVGGAAGALIGLQFVVMTLLAERPAKSVREASPAFSTPTIVHFSACLLLSALIRVPWPSAIVAAWAWGAVGLFGLSYSLLVSLRMHRQQAYQPDREDWLFYSVTPVIGYLILLLSAPRVEGHETQVLFAVGASSLILLFTGIRNSWDSVLFVSTGQFDPGAKDQPSQKENT
jgi:hypothetical protein